MITNGNKKLCPCNSGASYAGCCELLFSGASTATTAESLMRSRYTAYVVGYIDYLLRTWHPSTRPADIDPATIPKWLDLRIIRTEKGMEKDNEGVVEFKASSLYQKKAVNLHEVSRFVKENGQWLYVDGDIQEDIKLEPVRVIKVGRNDPCSCGSGKKFKKCCGA